LQDLIKKGRVRHTYKKAITMKIIVGLALFFSLCGIGNAQSQSSVKEFSDRLLEKHNVLDKISTNILQMMQGAISETDFSRGIRAHDPVEIIQADVNSLLMVSGIYTLMVDDRDIKVVKVFFDISCRTTISRGELAIETINKILPTIQSAALVNEVTNLRDAHISILQTLEFCKTN
jgi:hypothetical protein